MPSPFLRLTRAAVQQTQTLVQRHTLLSKHVALALAITCFSNASMSHEHLRAFPDSPQLEAQAQKIVSHSKSAGHVSKNVQLSITSGTSLFYPLRFLTASNTIQMALVRNQSHAAHTSQGCHVTLNHTEVETIAKTLQDAVPEWSAESIVDLVAKHEIAHCEDATFGMDAKKLAQLTVSSAATLLKWDANEQVARTTALESRLKQEPWLQARIQEQYADLSAWILSAQNWDESKTGVKHGWGAGVWQGWRYQNNALNAAHDTSHSLALLRKIPQETLAELSFEEAKTAARLLSSLAAVVPDFKTLDAIDLQPAFQPSSTRLRQAVTPSISSTGTSLKP